jgi:uncharacterized protein (TIGR00725 family)
MRTPVIGIMGATHPSPHHLALARDLGRRIAEAGWILLSGGRNAGIMDAASAGAKEIPGSLTLGILPDATGDVSPHVDVAVFTDLGSARNNVNVLTSDVVVACGVEGAGTASEVALALKAGKTVVLLACHEAAATFFQGLAPGEVAVVADVEPALAAIKTALAARLGRT